MREVTTHNLAQALDHGATVVDVREPGTYAERHVPYAWTRAGRPVQKG